MGDSEPTNALNGICPAHPIQGGCADGSHPGATLEVCNPHGTPICTAAKQEPPARQDIKPMGTEYGVDGIEPPKGYAATAGCSETYYISETTTQVQKMLGSMLKDFDAFCTEHGLDYWVDSGTLLGAVRHRGFIPWDDDCDVAMPREDFNKLVQLREKLPDYIFFEYHIINPSSLRLQTRLRHRYTRVKETGVPDLQGLFLDVFPFDNYNPDGSLPKGFGICKRMNELATLNRWNAARQSARSLKQYIIKLTAILFYLPNRFFPRWHVRLYGSKVKKYTEMAARLDTKYFSYGYDLPWQHYCFHKDWVYPLQRVRFEDFTVNAPAQTDTYLRATYGGDYMTPPGEDERRTHFESIEINDQPF